MKRFTPNMNGTFQKNRDPVQLSKELSMDKFLGGNVSSEAGNHQHKYFLKSLVYHIGSTAFSGHYTADALRFRPRLETDAVGGGSGGSGSVGENKVPEWVSFDDSRATVTKLSDIVGSLTCQKAAYMLLYSMD